MQPYIQELYEEESKIQHSFQTKEYYKSQEVIPRNSSDKKHLCLQRENAQISIIKQVIQANNIARGDFLDFGCNQVT